MNVREGSLRQAVAFRLLLLGLFCLSAPPSALGNSTLTATFIGVGTDVVSRHAFVPDGQPDFHILLGGLRSLPTQIQVTSDTGRIWSTPSNGHNWIVGLASFDGATADIAFAKHPGSKFH